MNTTNAQLFSILKTDHRIISGIIEEIQNRIGDYDAKLEGLFSQLKAELELHTAAEEQAVYTKLARNSATQRDELQAVQRHDEIRSCLNELDLLSVTDDIFERTLLRLNELVDQHVTEEENEVFIKMQEFFNLDDLDKMADDFQAAKESIISNAIAA